MTEHTLTIWRHGVHVSLCTTDEFGGVRGIVHDHNGYGGYAGNLMFSEARDLWYGTCAEDFTIELTFAYGEPVYLQKRASEQSVLEINSWGNLYHSKERFLTLLFEAKTVRLVAPAERSEEKTP